MSLVGRWTGTGYTGNGFRKLKQAHGFLVPSDVFKTHPFTVVIHHTPPKNGWDAQAC